MANKGYIFEASGANFEQLVLQNSRRGLVLVDFWSPRAGPSLRQREMLTQLAESMGGRFLLATVNTDQEHQLARDYGVHSLPSFKLFRNGRVVEEVRGVQPEADYRTIVERHLAGSGSAVQRAALLAWQQGEQDKAIGILADGAMAEPEDPGLPLLMAKLLVQAGRHRDAHQVLTTLPPPACDHPEIAQLAARLDFLIAAADAPDAEQLQEKLEREPDDHAHRYQLAALLLERDDPEGAMEQLMDIQRRAPEFRNGQVRKGLLALFEMLGAGDERVKRFRAELFNLSH
jgi:putative thioredoxin